MSALWIFIIIAALLTIYFHTEDGKRRFKGIRSNIVLLLGTFLPIADQVMAQFQFFNWDAYLDKGEALVAHLLSITLGAWFSFLKKTDK